MLRELHLPSNGTKSIYKKEQVGQLKIAVRLDDITPDMDYEKFYKMKQILDTYQIKPLIGVVPFNEDKNLMRSPKMEDFAGFLQGLTNEGWVVALHGYEHLYSTSKGGLFPLNHFSEFAGLSFEKQDEMIAKGKDRLASWGIATDIFMAPAHSFDKNTLKALKKNGFVYVTDGFGKKPFVRNGLIFLPIAIKQSDCYKDTEGYTTLVYHTNTMDDKDFERCKKMFEDNRESLISYEEMLKQTPRKRGMFGNIWEFGVATCKHLLVKLRAKARA